MLRVQQPVAAYMGERVGGRKTELQGISRLSSSEAILGKATVRMKLCRL